MTVVIGYCIVQSNNIMNARTIFITGSNWATSKLQQIIQSPDSAKTIKIIDIIIGQLDGKATLTYILTGSASWSSPRCRRGMQRKNHGRRGSRSCTSELQLQVGCWNKRYTHTFVVRRISSCLIWLLWSHLIYLVYTPIHVQYYGRIEAISYTDFLCVYECIRKIVANSASAASARLRQFVTTVYFANLCQKVFYEKGGNNAVV